MMNSYIRIKYPYISAIREIVDSPPLKHMKTYENHEILHKNIPIELPSPSSSSGSIPFSKGGSVFKAVPHCPAASAT